MLLYALLRKATQHERAFPNIRPFDKLRTGLSSPRSGRIEACPEPVEAGLCNDQLSFLG